MFPDDDQNGKSSDDKVENTAAQSNSVNNEDQNGKSAAGKGRRAKRQLWEYEPAVDSASKYWDVGVEGKRTRTLNKASYAEEDARSDSEEDPEDLFKPQREEESSSESENEPIAKKLVTPPPTLPPFPTNFFTLTLFPFA